MKNTIFKSILALVMAFLALPMMGQDFMNFYFKDGKQKKFYLMNVTDFHISNEDGDGVQHSDYLYQHINTSFHNYVYALEDIDSISFTKFDKEKVVDNLSSAMDYIMPTLKECRTIEEAEKLIDLFKQANGVLDVWSDGHNLFVKIKDWETLSFHFNHDINESEEVAANQDSSFMKLRDMLKSKTKSDIYGEKKKFAMVHQEYFDENPRRIKDREDYYEPLLAFAYDECNMDTAYIRVPDLDFFINKLWDYDIVILATHGGYDHGLNTGDFLGVKSTKEEYDNAVEKYSDIINNYNIPTEGYVSFSGNHETRNKEEVVVYYVGIEESFFEYVVPEGKHFRPFSILFNTACCSMYGENEDEAISLAKILTEKRNLGVYLGYNQPGSNGPRSSYEFFLDVLNGKFIGTAYEELGDISINKKYVNEYDVGTLKDTQVTKYDSNGNITKTYIYSLKMYPEKDFLSPIYTMKKEQEKVNQEYASNKTVSLEGMAGLAITDFKGMEFGFSVSKTEFGFDPILNTQMVRAEVVPMNFSSDKGNVLFRGIVENLIPGQTYYYRAYAYDKTHYNLGEPYSFTIEEYPNLALSTNSITLSALTCSFVDITSGSGSYSISENTAPNVVTASISESRITLEAHKAGTANITVKDNISGKTATLSVTVTEYTPSNRPAIDLALPSGTLWASCNVGATEPEDFGGYYAWGETEEKSNYDWDSYIFNISSEYSYNMTKYCTDSRYGTLDNKTTLDPEDDVAHVEWGGKWRMPTTEEIDELMANCSQEWIKSKGVWGCKFTGSNGNFIFLPAAGYRWYAQLEYSGTSGTYWSSSLNTDNPNTSYDLRISRDGAVEYFQNRYIGQCVRPVMSNSIPPADLSLSSYTMELTSGETKTVTITSGSGNYTVESNDPNVAQADEKDGLVTIIGRRPSTVPAIITVTDNVTTQTATITVTVVSATDYSTGEAIDLGLPSGTLWASCNIGASSEVEAGSFFAWGETEAKQTFYRSNYQYYDSSTETYKSLGYNISGTQYDAAHVIWGGAWRMPSMADFRELRDNCQSKWTTFKGVICKQYIGPNGKSIYLPAAGYYSGDVLKEKDETGNYWSADLYPKDEKCAYLIVTENSSQNTTYYGGRSLGATIRPVQKTSIPEEDRITQVIPEEFLDLLDDHITIYNGNNPPIIEGEYLVKPCTMQYDSDGDFSVGHEFTPKQIKVSNQDILNNTIDYEEKQGSSVAKGIGSFISGDGDNFSVFFNIEGVDYFSEYDVYTKKAMIVSGIKTANGIRNLAYAFIITSKSDDPQNKIMDVGDYRVIRDGDGLAENYPWNAQSPSKKRSIDESETLLPEDTNDSSATRKRATGKNNVVRVVRKE